MDYCKWGSKVRFAIYFVLACVIGCETDVRLDSLLTSRRINHASGLSIVELNDTMQLDRDEYISLSYPANHVGRSKLWITVSSTVQGRFPGVPGPPEAFTRSTFNLDEFEQINETTWFKSSDHQGGKRPSKDVDIVREISGRWVLLEIGSTVDFQNLREFSLDFAKSIEVSESTTVP